MARRLSLLQSIILAASGLLANSPLDGNEEFQIENSGEARGSFASRHFNPFNDVLWIGAITTGDLSTNKSKTG